MTRRSSTLTTTWYLKAWCHWNKSYFTVSFIQFKSMI